MSMQLQPTTVLDEWNQERVEFIRKTFCGNAPDPIAMTFIEIARRRNLSPEERHIYLVNRGGRGRPDNWVIQTGIDGYRSMAARSGEYAGSDDAVFVYKDEHIVSATVTVWRMVKGQRCPFTATARWSEYNAPGSPMWQKMPHTMIAKCAEALALRKAFPAELAGIYTSDEMDQAGQPAGPLPSVPLQTHASGSQEQPMGSTWGLPDDHSPDPSYELGEEETPEEALRRIVREASAADLTSAQWKSLVEQARKHDLLADDVVRGTLEAAKNAIRQRRPLARSSEQQQAEA